MFSAQSKSFSILTCKSSRTILYLLSMLTQAFNYHHLRWHWSSLWSFVFYTSEKTFGSNLCLDHLDCSPSFDNQIRAKGFFCCIFSIAKLKLKGDVALHALQNNEHIKGQGKEVLYLLTTYWQQYLFPAFGLNSAKAASIHWSKNNKQLYTTNQTILINSKSNRYNWSSYLLPNRGYISQSSPLLLDFKTIFKCQTGKPPWICNLTSYYWPWKGKQLIVSI